MTFCPRLTKYCRGCVPGVPGGVDAHGTKHHLHSDVRGGLGVRSVVLLAPSAYLTSAASTAECTSTLLPARLRDIKDSGIDAALSAWSKQATSPAIPSIMPVPPTSSSQRARCSQTLYSMQPLTQLAVLVFFLLVLRAPATG